MLSLEAIDRRSKRGSRIVVLQESPTTTTRGSDSVAGASTGTGAKAKKPPRQPKKKGKMIAVPSSDELSDSEQMGLVDEDGSGSDEGLVLLSPIDGDGHKYAGMQASSVRSQQAETLLKSARSHRSAELSHRSQHEHVVE
eukprot:GFYU01013228.1.p2 GENE.GFYU01013228.1~~GFYU01013228.1.p2  ORF type:complete len:140 (-),score=33.68 GFYU01013228.1:57-476(-)